MKDLEKVGIYRQMSWITQTETEAKTLAPWFCRLSWSYSSLMGWEAGGAGCNTTILPIPYILGWKTFQTGCQPNFSITFLCYSAIQPQYLFDLHIGYRLYKIWISAKSAYITENIQSLKGDKTTGSIKYYIFYFWVESKSKATIKPVVQEMWIYF